MTRIGRYEVVSLLGKGAFGQVYRAWDPGVGRHVAIKVVTTETDADLLARFRQEAGTTANLIHKNIVTVYEFGEHEGMPFLAMELLEGETLEDVINGARAGRIKLSTLEKAGILAQVVEGLHYAHARGVVHRDIKPGNIVRLPNGVVKILDFGIARALNSMATRRTRDGDMVGTFLYMAPEQFRSSEADVLTDIFSFGDVAYELLAGEHPFEGKDVGTIMFKITSVDPPFIRVLNKEVPEGLDHVVQRCLAKLREMRYQNLEDVLFDLQPVLQELRSARAQELLAEARPLLESADTEAALRAVRQVLELEPANIEARRLRDDLQARVQHQVVRARIQVFLEQGDSAAERREYTDAISHYESALRLDRNDESITQRIEAVRAKLDARRRSARLLAEARVQLEAGQPSEALRLATLSAETDPLNSEADTLIARINQALVERERREAFDAALAQAQALSAAGELDRAAAALDVLVREHPLYGSAVETVRRDVLARIAARERAAALEQFLSASRQQLDAGELDQAQRLLVQLQERYPDAPEARERAAEIASALAARERRQRVESLTRRGVELLAAGSTAEALRLAESAVADYPGEDALEELLARARAARAEEEKQRYIAGVIARARELMREGRMREALGEVDAARGFYPHAEELQAAHDEVTSAIEQERRRHAEYEAGIQRALDNREWLTALAACEAARAAYPDEDLFFELTLRTWRDIRKQESRTTGDVVRRCLKEDRVQEAEDHLNSARSVFGEDTVLHLLERELAQRKAARA